MKLYMGMYGRFSGVQHRGLQYFVGAAKLPLSGVGE